VSLLGLEEIVPELNILSLLHSSGAGIAVPVLVSQKLNRQNIYLAQIIFRDCSRFWKNWK
jgi:hypothetical protein